jgi:multidrug resistance efflux pump
MNAHLNFTETALDLMPLLLLGKRARQASSPEELGFIAVNETRELLDYRQASLWLSTDVRGVVSVSGVSQPDVSGPYLQWLSRVFKAQQGGLTQTKVLVASDLSPVVAEEWGQWLPEHALLIPLFDHSTTLLGVLLLARESEWQEAEIAVATEAGQIYAHALFALRPHQAWSVTLGKFLRSRKWMLRAALAVFIVMWLPVRLSTLMHAEVTPVDPFVVRAPLEGVVDRFQVQPNEFVAEGAALFNLDTTALQSRNATAREEYETAREQYRQSAQLAVTDDKAKLDMTLHKGVLDQKAVDLAYTASQLERVQVKAARAGVAVFADVHDWIGRAVVTGEKVMMLADPGKVELTARMPVGDQINVEPGAEIVFYPQSAPFTSYVAVVDSIAYHAEPADENVLAYRIRAHFKTESDLPRLGLMGSARVYAGRVPLGYLLLRRPLAVIRQWLAW